MSDKLNFNTNKILCLDAQKLIDLAKRKLRKANLYKQDPKMSDIIDKLHSSLEELKDCCRKGVSQ